jgi:hypothetical protein
LRTAATPIVSTIGTSGWTARHAICSATAIAAPRIHQALDERNPRLRGSRGADDHEAQSICDCIAEIVERAREERGGSAEQRRADHHQERSRVDRENDQQRAPLSLRQRARVDLATVAATAHTLG